jgi:hypothetical protein
MVNFLSVTQLQVTILRRHTFTVRVKAERSQRKRTMVLQVIPQKIRNRITLGSSNSTSGCIPQRTESRDLKRYL